MRARKYNKILLNNVSSLQMEKRNLKQPDKILSMNYNHQKVMSSNCSLAGMCHLPTDFIDEVELELMCFNYDNKMDEVVALIHKSDTCLENEIPIVRVHSACITGEVFGSQKCDCGFQFRNAMKEICSAPFGIMLYMTSHEGRGIGLGNKIRAYKLQEKGANTLEANEMLGFGHDLRDFKPAVSVLNFLSIKQIKLITNNPDKVKSLEAGGISVIEQICLSSPINTHNASYLNVKKDILHHRL